MSRARTAAALYRIRAFELRQERAKLAAAMQLYVCAHDTYAKGVNSASRERNAFRDACKADRKMLLVDRWIEAEKILSESINADLTLAKNSAEEAKKAVLHSLVQLEIAEALVQSGGAHDPKRGSGSAAPSPSRRAPRKVVEGQWNDPPPD